MPITFTVDESRRRVAAAARGVITQADVLEFWEDRRAHGVLGHSVLIDCGDSLTDMTSAQVRDLVEVRRQMRREHTLGPVAVVAERDLLYGMVRMYEILMEDSHDFHVFRMCDAAEAWLDGQPVA